MIPGVKDISASTTQGASIRVLNDLTHKLTPKREKSGNGNLTAGTLLDYLHIYEVELYQDHYNHFYYGIFGFSRPKK